MDDGERRKNAPGPLAGVSVVVVEDHLDSLEYLHEMLEYQGAVVFAAESARQALEIVSKVTPSVIITDIAMPQHDGIWLLKQLRHHQQMSGRYVPVLALTASATGPLQADFDAILVKPCPINTLTSVIRRLL